MRNPRRCIMTKRHRLFPVLLLLSTVFASMVVLTSTVGADSRTVSFNEPVTVEGTVLKPGTYTVVWTGTGPEVQVSFIRNGRTVTTATARLDLERNPLRSITTKTLPDNSSILLRLSFKHLTLFFDGAGGSNGTRPVSVA